MMKRIRRVVLALAALATVLMAGGAHFKVT